MEAQGSVPTASSNELWPIERRLHVLILLRRGMHRISPQYIESILDCFVETKTFASSGEQVVDRHMLSYTQHWDQLTLDIGFFVGNIRALSKSWYTFHAIHSQRVQVPKIFTDSGLKNHALRGF